MDTLRFVNLLPEHAAQLAELQKICYPHTPLEALYKEHEFVAHAAVFPEGTFVVLDRERVVGVGAGIFLDFDLEHPEHDLDELTGTRYENHNPSGEWYYGTEIGVHPDYRGRGIARRLYDLRKGLVVRCNKRGFVAGGVLPGYAAHRHEMSAQEYVDRVVAGELFDSTLTVQLHNGFTVHGVLADYFPDEQTGGWASLIVWENPEYLTR
ncbi:MAG: GNAT family N-acetyltransferase [Caldilineaceae bacterium]|nr:GNAT family N-acetyltransferase [Caldilineaceae bacterium]